MSTFQRVSDAAPVYIMGRQHCGNTMLAEAFAMTPEFLATRGEDSYFDQRPEILRAGRDAWADAVHEAVAGSEWPRFPEELQRALREFIQQRAQDVDAHPDKLYLWAHEFLAERQGKTRWCKKATSYVFYVPQLLALFPNAQLIFSIRNPFDLASSVKRRTSFNDVPRMLFGWDRGVRLALHYQAQYPEQFRVLRYEDLVDARSTALQSLMRAVGVSQPPKASDIPQVNPANRPYAVASAKRGVTSAHCYRYAEHLTPEEIGTVRALTPASRLRALYPDLESVPRASLLDVGRTCAGPLLHACSSATRALVRSPRTSVERVIRRLS